MRTSTLEGANENDVAIGDQFRWGDVLLEIAQPRAPCFKLGIHAREDIPARMTDVRAVAVGISTSSKLALHQ